MYVEIKSCDVFTIVGISYISFKFGYTYYLELWTYLYTVSTRVRSSHTYLSVDSSSFPRYVISSSLSFFSTFVAFFLVSLSGSGGELGAMPIL